MTANQLLHSPMMFDCRPYALRMHRRYCAYFFLEGRIRCQDCAQGVRMRKDYPDFVRQAKERLKKPSTPPQQAAMRRAHLASVMRQKAQAVMPWVGRVL